MATGFPLSDTISFQSADGWYDLMVTTVYLPADLTDSGRPGYRTAADLHGPHAAEGDATLLEALMRDYDDAEAARAGHAETVRLVEERAVALPIPEALLSERKLPG